ncbi:MAG: prepilin peptidase [Nitrospira sp.]
MTLELSIIILLLVTVLGTAIVTDLRSSRIPNWLTFPAMGLGILIQAWIGGLTGALSSLAGLGLGTGLFFLLYLSKALGAGDVKLMAAIGAMLGPSAVLSVVALSMMVGGVYALGAMGYQWGLTATSRKLACATYGTVMTGGATGVRELQLPFKLRYGLAIAVGTLLFLGGVRPFGG